MDGQKPAGDLASSLTNGVFQPCSFTYLCVKQPIDVSRRIKAVRAAIDSWSSSEWVAARLCNGRCKHTELTYLPARLEDECDLSAQRRGSNRDTRNTETLGWRGFGEI
jgi:phage terminase large subunit-like protein